MTGVAGRFLADNYAWLLIAASMFLLCTRIVHLFPMGLMAMLGLWRAAQDPGRAFHDRWSRTLLLLFLCLWLPQLLSLVDAVNPGRSARTALLYPLYLFCGLFMLQELARPGRLFRIALVCLACAVFWCVDALFQYAVGVNLLGYPYQEDGLSGMFYPKLRLGIVLAVFTPVALETLRQVNSRGMLSWLLLIPFTVIIFLTGRRSAWLMLAAALLAYLPLAMLTMTARARCVLAGALGLAVLLAAAVYVNDSRVNQRAAVLADMFEGRYQAERATSWRVSVWEAAGSMLRDHWLNGVGPRGFRRRYSDYAAEDNYFAREGQTHPHLAVLEIAVETGVIGLAGFILFYFIILRFWRRARRAAGAVAWCAALLTIAFPLNAHLAFYGSYWGGFLWLFIPCALAALRAAGET